VFGQPPDPDAKPVFDWLFSPKRDGSLVYGGKLAGELLRVGTVSRAIKALRQAGRAFLIPADDVKHESSCIKGQCVSNGAHVIALARASGARLLYSHDHALQQDFKNAKLVSQPRGKVYTAATHAKLLRHTNTCPRARRSPR